MTGNSESERSDGRWVVDALSEVGWVVEDTTGVRRAGELRKRRKIMLHPSEGEGIVIVETTREGRMKDHATFAAPGVAVFAYPETALLTLATTRPRTEAEAARIPDAENIDRRRRTAPQ